MKTTFQHTLLAALLTTLPTFAVEVGSYDELKKALSDKQENITLKDDIQFTASDLSIGSDVTIDGNYYSLSGSESFSGFKTANNVTLTIKNFGRKEDKQYIGGIQNFTKKREGAVFYLGNDSTLNIENSFISGNKATTSDGVGGVIFANGTALISIKNSTISNNYTYDAGAVIGSWGNSTPGISVIITDSVFENNVAETFSGGVTNLNSLGEKFIIENSVFRGNESRQELNVYADGGGVFWLTDQTGITDPNAAPTFYNCEFSGNKAYNSGGVMFFDALDHITTVQFIVDSTFEGNSAELVGGAIFASDSTINIFAHNKDVLFNDNHTADDDIYAGSDIYLSIKYEENGDCDYLKLVAAPNRKIVFNGNVSGYESYNTFVYINKEKGEYYLSDGVKYEVSTGGEVQFNGGIACVTVEMYEGKLSIGQNGKSTQFADIELQFKGDSTFYAQNGLVDRIGPTEKEEYGDVEFALTIDKGVRVDFYLDVDLSTQTADCLHNATNNGTLALADVALISDTTAGEVKIMYSTNNVEGVFADGQESWVVSTSNHTYTVSLLNEEGEGSFLVFTRKQQDATTGERKKGLAGAVYEVHDVWNNTDPDIHWVTWYPDDKTGTMEPKNYLEKDLIVNSHNKAIRSEVPNQEGMIVGEEFKATINNARDWSGFRNGIINRGRLYINDSNFTGNTGEAGVLNEGGEVHLAGDITFDNPAAEHDLLSRGGSVHMHAGHATFQRGVHGTEGATFDIAGDVDFNGLLSGFERVKQTGGTVNVTRVRDTHYEIDGGRLHVRREEDFRPTDLTFGGGTISAQNSRTGDICFDTAHARPGAVTNIEVDIDLGGVKMDRLLPGGADAWPEGATINVSKFNVLTDTTAKTLYVNFTNSYLKYHVTHSVKTVYGPIYNYNIGYDADRGDFYFTAQGGGSWSGYNPAIVAAPVAALTGGYLAQLNSYDDAFRNMDMYMLNRSADNSYMIITAGKDGKGSTVGNSATPAVSPAYARTNYWVRPFTSFENVPLRHGPNVANTTYGALIGNESRMYDLGDGWSGLGGGYLGYYGSHQSYPGASIYQDTAMAGVVSMAYSGDLYAGFTANIGAASGRAKTMFGRDNFSMLTAGAAAKAGYNYALEEGKYVLQPFAMVSYSLVNPFSYTNAAGVRITADPMHALHLEPGMKFIADLGDDLQLYTSASFVFNFFDKTRYKANGIELPEMSIKHYVKYGLGLQQTWSSGITGYIQAYMTNGGRNSLGLQCGLRWAFGDD